MTDGYTFELSVTDLVAFVFRSGSIDHRSKGTTRMQLGSRIHKLLQQRDQEKKDNYKREVTFKFNYYYRNCVFIFSGRADAVYTEDGKPVIEEIKTTNRFKSLNFEPDQQHLAQLYFYAFFYAAENNLDEIQLCLHYYHLPNEESSYLKETKTRDELEEMVRYVLDKWLETGFLKAQWEEQRNQSIKTLPFVYDEFRAGQREISLAVYNTIKRKDKVLIEAPTGIGKTIGTLFPAIKSLPQSNFNQIYYLTAKTTIQNEVNKAIRMLKDKGLSIKATSITAREKICFLNQEKPNSRNCNPDDCIYARDYYSKIENVIGNILKSYSLFDRKTIEQIAVDYEVCPYQLALDLSNWSDIVICDYNYVFDPVSAIEGYSQNRVYLVDEAHNLPDRSREMYSASLSLDVFRKLRAKLGTKEARKEEENNKLRKQVNRIIWYLNELKEEYQTVEEENIKIDEETISEIKSHLFQLQNATFKYLVKLNSKKIPYDAEIMEAFNTVSGEIFRFSAVEDLAVTSENYYNYLKITKRNIVVRLVCLDTSEFLKKSLENNTAVFFSATLTPFEYYKTLILGDQDVPTLALPSPFQRDHYRVFCDTAISTRYSDRETSYGKIANNIKTVVTSQKGNYLIFFPSYNYLDTVYNIFIKLVDNEDLNIIVQNPNMNDEDREEFIKHFRNERSTVGFCVMGGIFSEGVDLPLDALIGTIIIGPGIPGIDYERNLIKDYFEKENGNGYAYAYAYPGMNRVLQSAGRVIRTKDDRGVILLIDDRFRKKLYKEMIPNHLIPDYLNNPIDLERKLLEFWGDDQQSD